MAVQVDQAAGREEAGAVQNVRPANLKVCGTGKVVQKADAKGDPGPALCFQQDAEKREAAIKDKR